MSTASKSVITGLFTDETLTTKGRVGDHNTINWAVGKLKPDVAKRVNETFRLQPPLKADEMKVRYFPSGLEQEDRLSSLGNMPFIALFSPGEHQKDVIKDHFSAMSAQAPSDDKRFSDMLAAIENLKSRTEEQGKVVENQGRVIEGLEMKNREQERAIEKQGRTIEKQGRTIEKLEMKNGEQGRAIEKLEVRNGEQGRAIEKLEVRNGEQGRAIEKLEMKNGKLENENEEQGLLISGLRNELQQERHGRNEDFEALRKVTLLIMPLHLRVLLDLTRQKILEDLNCESWETLRDNHNIYQLTDVIFQSLPQLSRPSRETIEFLCSYNNVRHDGNSAAHSASKEEVKKAVCGKPIESKDRRCLEEMYVYTFGDEI